MQNCINHIVFVLDRSGSMSGRASQVVKVFDSQIEYLAQRSKELDQETRVTVYQFGNDTECLVYDKDVLRLPSLAKLYKINGNTALLNATAQAIDELAETPQRYGDHSFLIYVLTDGQENWSHTTGRKTGAAQLAEKIKKLPENWTLAVMVPDQNGVFDAKKFGFPANNIAVWNTTSEKGVEEVGNTLRSVTNTYMTARSRGVRGTKSLFQLDSNALASTNVKNVLEEVKAIEYDLLPVHKDAVIKPFVESWTQNPYRVGSTYYQLTKPETLQAYKQIAIQDKATGKVYSGVNARKLLGLPDFTVKVNPADFGKFDVFAQSTSTNRKLVGGTKLIVFK
jgi:hypothetical protein